MLYKIKVAQESNPVDVFKPIDRRGNLIDLKPLTPIFTALVPTYEIVLEMSEDEDAEIMQMCLQIKNFGVSPDIC